jgi:hypothetical protein
MAGERWEAVKRWATTVAGVLAALPVLYVLSTGPAIRVIAQSNLSFSERLVRAYQIYWPLVWVADRCPPFADALMWYVRLWQ